MTESENELWPLITHMCLAAFLAREPAYQVRKIAKEHLRSYPNTKCKNSLKKIIKSRDPVTVVLLVNEDVKNDS